MHRNRSVNTHAFSMIPRADIPRATFNRQFAHKTTFDAGYLVPFYVDEVLPGDHFHFHQTSFARMQTPIAPIMDNLHFETFFFFIPNRLVWEHWQNFMGEEVNPGENQAVEYLVPQQVSPLGGYAPCSLQDYMGLPTQGQVAVDRQVSHSALWLRAYNLVFNEWFRDENLIDSLIVDRGDSGDNVANYVLRKRGKRHDYFTSCLPWPAKGTEATIGIDPVQASLVFPNASTPLPVQGIGLLNAQSQPVSLTLPAGGSLTGSPVSPVPPGSGLSFAPATVNLTTGLMGAYADLSLSSSVTINQLRTSFQVQKLLERDARGGTRYTEILRNHFGVTSPDARLQRPEYLGGSHSPVNISPVAQTSGTGASGQTSPQGNLAAIGTLVNTCRWSQAFVEHGMILGIACIRADLTYQQGINRMWLRKQRGEFYFPVFACLGEDSVYNKEIFCIGEDPTVVPPEQAQDMGIFGYQERWAEYRYKPSQISGMFKSTTNLTLDYWHLAQRFDTLPTLSQEFIEENVPIPRIIAEGSLSVGQQFLFDSFVSIRTTRPMPLYSVPGLIDHF